MNKNLLKTALLSVSLLVATAPAINANIPQMAASFENVPLVLIEMITTIPSLFLMISVLTSSFIAQKFGYKRTILLGITLVAIAGVTPAIVDNFYVIFASRAVLGFGIGLFNSLLIGYISYFFKGNERVKLIGYHEALGGLGGMLITFIAGRLMTINWQVPFLAYAIAFPVIFMFSKFVPDVKSEEIISKKETSSNNNGSMNFVFAFMLLIFIGAILNMTMGVKVSTLMVNEGYGQSSDASLVIMFLSFGAMLSGFLFGRIYKLVGNYILPLGFSVVALAMYLIGISNNVYLTVLGGFLVGFGFRVMMPTLTSVVNNSNIKNTTLATSLLLVAYNLGSAIAPFVSVIFENISTNGLRGVFYLLSLSFIGLVIIVTIVIKVKEGVKNVSGQIEMQ